MVYRIEVVCLKKRYPVDVICLHSRDGTIIPIRIRLEDEDGITRAYKICGYKDLSDNGTYTTKDDVFVTNDTLFYECRLDVLERKIKIRLYYKKSERNWFMTIL